MPALRTYILYIDNYSLQFSDNVANNTIKCVLPHYTVEIDYRAIELPTPFKQELESLGWTSKMINRVENMLLSHEPWKNGKRLTKEGRLVSA
jgi:hypothetical protein